MPFTAYKHGISTQSDTVTGDAGLAINNNFVAIGNAFDTTPNIRGAWSSITTYAINDIVTLSGSYYIATAISTNQTPPNASFWNSIGGALTIDQVLATGNVTSHNLTFSQNTAAISGQTNTATTGVQISITGGQSTGGSANGGQLAISGGAQSGGTGAGGVITVSGGLSSAGSAGGAVSISGGTALAGTGGNVIIAAGSGTSANGQVFVNDGTGATKLTVNASGISAPVISTPSLNKVTVTTPASTATLTIANNKTLTSNNSITLAGTDGSTLSLAGNLTTSGAFNTTLTTTGTTNITLPTSGTLLSTASTNAIPLSSFATGGNGTYGNPFTGWQSSVTATSDVTYTLGSYWFGITSALVLTDLVNVTFKGDGINRCGFRWWNTGTTGTMFSINNSGDTWCIGNNLFGLTFDGSDASGHTVPSLVLLSGQREPRWEDISFQNSAGSTGWPVRMEAVVVGTFTNLRITQHDATGISGTPVADRISYLATPTNGIILDQRSANEQCTCLQFNGLTVEQLTGSGIGIYLKNAFECQFSCCTAEDVPGTGLQIDSTNDWNVFICCDFEANGTGPVINGSFNSFIGGTYSAPAVGAGKNQFLGVALTNTANSGVGNYYANCYANGTFTDTGSTTYILNCQNLNDSLPKMGNISLTDGASIREGNNRIVFADGGVVIGFGDIDNAYSSNVTFYMSYGNAWNFYANASNTVVSKITYQGVFFPGSYATASAPIYAQGGMYYDTTLHKLRIGGASGWETVTSS